MRPSRLWSFVEDVGRRRQRAAAADFGAVGNWDGGYYELHIELGPSLQVGGRERMAAALAAVWTHPSMHGCYLDPRRGQNRQQRVEPAKLIEPHLELAGVARVPAGSAVVCVTHAAVDDPDVPEDWLTLGIPLAALGRLDPRLGGYPFGALDHSLDWRGPLDWWLVDIAHRVFDAVGFRFAYTGFEVAGTPEFDPGEEPPAERYGATAVARDGRLAIYPATQ